jgi:uncharacterized damage-inducible protein DinB
MIASVTSFLSYFESVRRRTLTFCHAIPEAQIDWSPRAGEFTCGDIVRHLAAAEQMFASVAISGRWSYPGHEPSLGPDLPTALAYLTASHASAVAALATMRDTDLAIQRDGIGGYPIAVWRVLMLMAEHEIHHRSQIGTYLSLIGVEPPQLYGLHLEEVIAYTEGEGARARG